MVVPMSQTNEPLNMHRARSAAENGDAILFMDDSVDGVAEHHRLAPNINDTEEIRVSSSSARYHPLQPLLETDNRNNPKPTFGPEIDDLEPEDTQPKVFNDNNGIDDGLLPKKPVDDPRYAPGYPEGPRSPYPFPNAPGMPQPGFPMMPVLPDVNVYQQKKTLAQGMMDLALLSANANQLRYVLQSSGRHPYYYPSIAMIGISLILQTAVGIGLIWNSRYNVKDDREVCIANKVNNRTVIGIFLVTLINVFISAFGIVESPSINVANTAGLG